MAKKKEIQKGEIVYIPVTFFRKFEEFPDTHYVLLLPEVLEYRFPESSIPMMIAHKNTIRRKI